MAESRSLFAKEHSIPEDEVPIPSADELKQIGFFSALDTVSYMFEVEASHRDCGEGSHQNGSAVTKMVRYCLLGLESALTREECEAYVRPEFEPGYKWFDVEGTR